MVEINYKDDIWGNKLIIFTVPLPNRPPVFMSMKVTDYNSNKSAVVIVDSEKFLQLWRNENGIHSEVANGSPNTWPSDYKYHHAVNGFSHGRDNPVPLAYVSHRMETTTIASYKFLKFGKSVRHEQHDCIGFTNGITRTIWLLSHGCKAFPVECPMPSAIELYRLASADGTNFHTIGELAAKVA